MAKIKLKPTPSNAIASQVLEELASIDRDAEHRKQAALKKVTAALVNVEERIAELEGQKKLLTAALAEAQGRKPRGGTRISFDETRARIERWLNAHKGAKYGAAGLAKEFPELQGKVISVVLKPLLTSGTIKREGQRGDTVYYVEG